MIIQYWCGTCRRLHATDTVQYLRDADATTLRITCPDCGGTVAARGIHDDPDDPEYGAQRCATCRAGVSLTARFCGQCGAPLPFATSQPPVDAVAAADQGAASIGELQSAQIIVQSARQRQHRERLADILGMLADLPGYRRQPQPGDSSEDFDAWFDGGAVRYLTSLTEYHFSDGSHASVHDLSLQTIRVELPDGARFTIEGPTLQPSFADRVLTAVVAECQRIVRGLHSGDAHSSTGIPPTQCMLVERMTSGARQDWLYDMTTNRLTAMALGIVDVSREPMNGMYYARGLIEYQVAEDRQTLEFSCTLGPRFGRGLRFALIETSGHLRLARPTLLWMS